MQKSNGIGWLCLLLALVGCGKSAPMPWGEGSYSGELSDGLPCGYGCYETAGGTYAYTGYWHKGKPKGLGRQEVADTLYEGEFRDGERCGEGRMRYPDGSTYRGAWRHNRRHGYGELTDSAGRVFCGWWTADSLPHGERRERGARYRGAFNAALQADGYGIFRTADGTYYGGFWQAGCRHGFGIAVEPRAVVKSGVWKQGRFRGEQMVYNAERVYGIDISKYQHGTKRRPCGIDWASLRITHLGTISKKRIQGGRVDYPVSFVYVKATEGVRILNAFYARDVRDARAHRYPVGAYHFFSTDGGARQAAHFLKHARPRTGDLPPMLDVELSDRQIAAMGGPPAMFREMLAWLRIVERRCGVPPVLYVGQQFVNRYMEHAPAELQAYKVWIARYGEYRPYVHLLHWQLSPDGRVRGIRGDVDIDVFNGTREQFRDYLEAACVR